MSPIGKLSAYNCRYVDSTCNYKNGNIVEELGICALRMFDGKYQQDELNSWQKNFRMEGAKLTDSIADIENDLSDLEKQKETIPQEIADASASQKEYEKELVSAKIKLPAYHSSEEQLKSVFEKYGLDFNLRFSNYAVSYIKEQLSVTTASITGEIRKIEATKEAIAAVKRGSLHIPKLLIEYLDSAGIHYISVEKYLLEQIDKGLISKNQCMDLLEKYPFAAYSKKLFS